MKEFRVLGPPGCGKTTYLTRQLNRAADKYGAEQVRAVSLTRASAAELRGRKTAVENIGTLHSMAYRELSMPDVAEPKFKEWNDYVLKKQPYFKLSGALADREDFASGSTIGDSCLQILGVARARQSDLSRLPVQVQQFAETWQAWKDETRYLDFQDLIDVAYNEIESIPCKALFVDEAQDMDASQIQLARKWGHQAETFVLAGDADQNLYQWRGTDPNVFLEPELPESHYQILGQSYRLPQKVQAYAMDWIEQIKNRRPAPFNPTAAVGSIKYMPELSLKNIHGIIEQLSMFGNTMILCSCGYMLQPVVEELKNQGIPFHNPYAVKRGDWNPLRQTAQAVDIFLKTGLWTSRELNEWVKLLPSKGVLIHGAKTNIKDFADGDLKNEVIPLDVLDKLFEPEALNRILLHDLDWLRSWVIPARRKMFEYLYQVVNKKGAAYLTETPKVIVGTIHSVKGGEADTVFVLPDLSRQFYAELVRNPDPLIRLFYVAITRAKQNVILCGQSSPLAMKWRAV